MTRTLKHPILLACLLVMAQTVTGGGKPGGETSRIAQPEETPIEAVRSPVAAGYVKLRYSKRLAIADVQPDVNGPDIGSPKLPEDTGKPVMEPWKPKGEPKKPKKGPKNEPTQSKPEPKGKPEGDEKQDEGKGVERDKSKKDKPKKDDKKKDDKKKGDMKKGDKKKDESKTIKGGKDDNNTTRLGPIPQRVDVRCRWERVKSDKNDIMRWYIWMSPNGNDFPNWCRNLEVGIRNSCRNKEGQLLQGNDPKDKKDKLLWTRCDLNATDDFLDGPGWVAAFTFVDWNKAEDNGLHAGVSVGEKCVEGSIRHAVAGAKIDWRMWRDFLAGYGCHQDGSESLHVPHS
ncbi:Fc.00g106580.m01.CDS01 [Cosmosporella sp. VM-42]